MLQVRKVSDIAGALVAVVVLGFTLLGGPGTAAQRGGGTPPPPTTFETLCVSVHNGLVRAISSGTCQGHEITVDVREDLPVTLCVNDITKVARAVEGSTNCAAREDRVEVTGFEDFEICVSRFTAVVRVPAPAACQAFEITGVLRAVIGADSYESLPNVGLDVPADDGLLANDAPAVEIASADSASQQGGDVAVNPDGSFTYAPPAGFTGVDTFDYIVRLGGDEIEREAEITVAGPVIWFANNGLTTEGDGRFSAPFNSAFPLDDSDADADAPGDIIFLFTGDGNYSGGLTLEEGQTLIGQCLDLVDTANITVPQFSAALPGVPAPGTPCDPFLGNVAGFGNALDLAPNTFVGGLSIGFGDHGINGADFTGDVEIRDVEVLQAAEDAVNLVNIDGTVTISDSAIVGRDGRDGLNGDDGRQGINAENVTLLDIDRGEASGGNGGDATAGDGIGGFGGDGIHLFATTATITATLANGGDGGDNLSNDGAGIGRAGTGGDGIFATEVSDVTLNGGETTAGDGGSGEAGGAGGNGLFVDDRSTATVLSASLDGGIGGSGTTSIGGRGGRGIVTQAAGPVSVGSSILTGGGGGFTIDSIAGSGGEAIAAFESEQFVVTLSQLAGSAGGRAELEEGLDGEGGSGLFARSTPVSVHDSVLLGGISGAPDRNDGNGFQVVQFEFGPLFVDVQNNVLQGAGNAASLSVAAFGPVACLNAVGNTDTSGEAAPVTAFNLTTRLDGPTLSITQESLEEISSDNNGVSITSSGQIGFSCTGG